MIEMDSDEIKKLKDMLDSESITPEVYDEIISRWTSSGNSHESESAKTDSGDGQIRKRGEAIRVAKINRKIERQRDDFSHKTSNNLVRDHDLIVFEDLNITGMVKNHHLAKSITDAGWNKIETV